MPMQCLDPSALLRAGRPGPRRRKAFAVLLSIAGMCAAGPAMAQVTIAVNSTAQEVTVAQPNGVANANCTLGEAILAANTRINVDACTGASLPSDPITITLLAGSYDFASVGAEVPFGIALLPMALPAVRNSITIEGNGALLQRSVNPNTPAMGFFSFETGTNLVFRGNNFTLARGVRGTQFAGGPDAFFNQGSATISQFRLTDVTLSGGLGTIFQISASGLIRLERVISRGAGGRTARGSLTAAGPGPAAIQVVDSEFADTRGSLLLNVSGNATGGAIVVSGSRFLRGRAGVSGAGLRITADVGSVNVSLSGNRFEDNFGTNGAGLELQFSGTSTVSTVDMNGNVFRGNVATVNGGGMRAISFTPAVYRIRMNGDSFERNTALDGAGIHLSGSLSEPLSITEGSFADNSATNGAAIAIVAQDIVLPRTALQVTRSAFTGNLDFGGVSTLAFVTPADHRVVIDNSTLAGNYAAGELVGSGGANTVYDYEALTVTGNSGETILEVGSGTASLRNSVIFANAGALACEISNGGAFQSGGGNYVQDASCDGVAQVLDPLLGPLALNGGSTLNRLPLAGSLLINGGVAPVLSPAFDQRGQQRVRFGVVDIGSVESDLQLVFASSFEADP